MTGKTWEQPATSSSPLPAHLLPRLNPCTDYERLNEWFKSIMAIARAFLASKESAGMDRT